MWNPAEEFSKYSGMTTVTMGHLDMQNMDLILMRNPEMADSEL